MRSHLLRWALTGITAATTIVLAAAAAPVLAGPLKTVVIGPGDSIDSLARRFHVAIKDIARANHISPDAVLVDGRKLRIPDPPKAAVQAATMHRQAWVNGDRISIRLGPDENARRLTLLDHGSQLVATAQHGDWTQVKLASGKAGWVRSDYLRLGGGASVALDRGVSGARVTGVPRVRRSRVAKADGDSDEASARHRARNRAAKARHLKQMARRHHLERVARAESRHKREAARRHGRMQMANRRSESSRNHRRPEADAPAADSDVIRTAYAYRGTPYHFGGSGRRGFDCSGFTSYIYGRKGVNLPHSAAGQFSRGRRIDSGHLKEGDLVFFHTTRRGISHVGIYAGNGKFVHASSGGGRVRVDSLSSGYYRERFRGARRVR